MRLYSVHEVDKQLEKMGRNKAWGPDDLHIEVAKIIADYNMGYFSETMNAVMQERLPSNWTISRLVPV